MISFIIPAYNEEALIGRAIGSIHEAAEFANRAYEIIVADDASTDRTAEVAAAGGARVIRVERRQIAAVRNAGARAARGDVLVFLDADTFLPEGTLRATLTALQRGAAAGGAAVEFDGRVPLYAHAILLVLTVMFRTFGYAAGCYIFCTRRAFDASGGFDEELFASEEIAMSKALKQHGEFVVVREPVITSGRKLRQNSSWRVLWTMISLGLRGPGALRKREGLDIWYDGRRET